MLQKKIKAEIAPRGSASRRFRGRTDAAQARNSQSNRGDDGWWILWRYDSSGARIPDVRYEQSKGYDWTFTLEMDAAGDLYAGGYVDAFTSSPNRAEFISLKFSGKSTDLERRDENIQFLPGCNYPNPVRGRTSIPFSLVAPGFISIGIFTVTGQLVDELVREVYSSGEHIASWQVSDASPGIYFCVMKSRGKEVVRNLIVIQ